MKNQRNKISLLIIAVMIFASFTGAFAAEVTPVPISAQVTAPKDVAGTGYEEAVKTLIEKGIITGYPDGTFRPEGGISRAEACVVVIKAMNPSEEAMAQAGKSGFPDLKGYDWAEKYINYAAAKGVITGYTNGTFGPAGMVSYAEMASMLIRALGYRADELTGSWPDNYISKAIEIGLFIGVINANANASATRGNVAIMTNAVADNIINGTRPETGGSSEDKDKDKDKGDGDADLYLSGYSGRAYGIVLDAAKVLNSKGDVVDEYEFLIGDKTLNIKTNGKFPVDGKSTIDTHLENGDLYVLKMSGGVATGFETTDSFSSTGFVSFTGTSWAAVSTVKNYVIETVNNHDSGTRKVFTVLDDASIYVATEENGEIVGYKPGTMRDVKRGKGVRLFSITGKNPGIVEVVLVSSTPND
jgi:hypothetical protein